MMIEPGSTIWISFCYEIRYRPYMMFGGIPYKRVDFVLDRESANVCDMCFDRYMKSDLAERFDGQIVPPHFQTPETEYWLKEHGIGKHG